MLASLEALMTLGKCGEMPVMGFVNGHLVVGIIVRPILDLKSIEGIQTARWD
jgi:hypothetical protein